MNILQVVPYYPPAWSYGGPGRVAFELTNQLAEKGHTITVSTTDAGDWSGRTRKELAAPAGVTIRRFRNVSNLAAWRYRLFAAPRALGPIGKIDEFDVVHLHDYRTMLNITFSKGARQHRVPLVLQAHGSLSDQHGHRLLKRIFDVSFGSEILRNATRAIALNDNEAALYVSGGADPENIRTIPNAIKPDTPGPVEKTVGLTERMGIPADSRLVLYLGRLHASKRLDLLVESFEVVARKVPNAFLVFAGPDDGFGSDIRRLIRDRALESRVLLTGFVREEVKFALLMQSDVLVVPMFSGFPITFLEACAAGTPIITTTASDSLAWLDNSVGRVVEPSKTALAEALLELCLNRASRTLLGMNGKRIVRERFTWERVLGQYVAVYEDCMDQRRRFHGFHGAV